VRGNLLLIDSPHLKYGSPQAHAAEFIWQKRNEIEAKKTILLAYSSLGSSEESRRELVKIANELVDDMIPFLKVDREARQRKMEDALSDAVGDIMQVEVPTEHLLKTRKLVPKKRQIERIKRTRRG
jgi:hypothetical protein